MASPRLELPASSRGGSLKAGQVWARLAHIRAATHQEPCQIGPLSRDRALPYWRRTWLRASRAFSLTGQGCLLFPRGGSLPCWLCTRLSGGGSGLLQQVLPQGRLPLSWGCGREHRHAGSAQKHLHMSLLGRRVLGNLPLSYTFWAPTESASGCPDRRPQPGALGPWCSPCGAESGRPSNRWMSPAVALPFPLTEFSLLEPLPVCNPPAPKLSLRRTGT